MTDPKPTQVRHPWRATVRTALAAAVALLPLVPSIVDVLGVGSLKWVAAIVAGVAAVTRVLALPVVDRWVRTWVPWLAPDPAQPQG